MLRSAGSITTSEAPLFVEFAVVFVQLIPPSTDLKTPPLRLVFPISFAPSRTAAYKIFGSVGSITRLPNVAKSKTEFASGAHVVPPLVDFKISPPGQETAAYAVLGSLGAKART